MRLTDDADVFSMLMRLEGRPTRHFLSLLSIGSDCRSGMMPRKRPTRPALSRCMPPV